MPIRNLEWVRDESRTLPILRAAFERWSEDDPIVFQADGVTAWHVVAALQLAWRHPELPAKVKEEAERVGRAIQTALADTPELDDILEAGWHTDFDFRENESEGDPDA